MNYHLKLSIGVLALAAAGVLPTAAQEPRPTMPRAGVGPGDRPAVDPAAADRGRRVWASECITCHGAQARGTDTAPSLLRSMVVLRDRYGSELGSFLKKGHPMQSGSPSTSLTDAQTVDLTHFLRQRIEDTLRGAGPFTEHNVASGNAEAGAAFFNGEGKCATCHNSTTNDLAGISSRLSGPVDVQQHLLFPGGRARRGSPSGGPGPTTVTVTLTPASGAPISGALVEMDDQFVTVRDASGAIKVVRRVPGLKVVKNDPLQAHHDLLDRLTDTNIHDLVAYLETMK
jgi:cytochrome c oxidase cbb3-type subunit III